MSKKDAGNEMLGDFYGDAENGPGLLDDNAFATAKLKVGSSKKTGCARRMQLAKPYASFVAILLGIAVVVLLVVGLFMFGGKHVSLLNNGTCTATGSGYCIADEEHLPADVRLLLPYSMLYKGRQYIYRLQNDGSEWRRPYGLEQSRDLIAEDHGDIWLDLYPAAVLHAANQSVISAMGDESLWKALNEVGITVTHTNPLHRSGGVYVDKGQLVWTPTVDGNYDRAVLQIDPLFGSDQDYLTMTSNARKYGGYIAGDVVPGHTGAAADWQLALRAFQDYPYIYHMAAIKPEHWGLLPPVSGPNQVVNLNYTLERTLTQLGYIDGDLDMVFFKAPGVKETDWSVTGEIVGVDGVTRRWVYLHMFKAGQPSLNWLHPSFAAHQLIIGDLIYTLRELGSKIVRFDANFVLGTERISPNSTQARALFHPLSSVSTQTLAMTVRKLGGYSYEENSANMQIQLKYGLSTNFGTDLSYDFSLRAGWIMALITKDLRLLKLDLDLMRQYDIGGGKRSIHSLQNHDELFIHFSYDAQNPNQTFTFGNETWAAQDIDHFVNSSIINESVKIGLPVMGTGVCSTVATVLCTRLGIDYSLPLSNITVSDRQRVIDAAITFAAFNALQPGLVQVSAWDALGVLQLDRSELDPHFIDASDCRYLNRGAYDLMDYTAGSATAKGVTGLPRAKSLFGSIKSQLAVGNNSSYLRQLQKMLAVRKTLNISLGDLGADVTPAKVNDKLVILPVSWASNPSVDKLVLLIINWADEDVSFDLDLRTITIPGVNLDMTVDAQEQWPDPSQIYKVANNVLSMTISSLRARIVTLKTFQLNYL